MGQTGSGHGVPGAFRFTHVSAKRELVRRVPAQIATIRPVDPVFVIVVIVVLTPVAIVWALAKSARLRGPATRKESKRPVESLVTDVIPHDPDEQSGDDSGAN